MAETLLRSSPELEKNSTHDEDGVTVHTSQDRFGNTINTPEISAEAAETVGIHSEAVHETIADTQERATITVEQITSLQPHELPAGITVAGTGVYATLRRNGRLMSRTDATKIVQGVMLIREALSSDGATAVAEKEPLKTKAIEVTTPVVLESPKDGAEAAATRVGARGVIRRAKDWMRNSRDAFLGAHAEIEVHKYDATKRFNKRIQAQNEAATNHLREELQREPTEAEVATKAAEYDKQYQETQKVPLGTRVERLRSLMLTKLDRSNYDSDYEYKKAKNKKLLIGIGAAAAVAPIVLTGVQLGMRMKGLHFDGADMANLDIHGDTSHSVEADDLMVDSPEMEATPGFGEVDYLFDGDGVKESIHSFGPAGEVYDADGNLSPEAGMADLMDRYGFDGTGDPALLAAHMAGFGMIELDQADAYTEKFANDHEEWKKAAEELQAKMEDYDIHYEQINYRFDSTYFQDANGDGVPELRRSSDLAASGTGMVFTHPTTGEEVTFRVDCGYQVVTEGTFKGIQEIDVSIPFVPTPVKTEKESEKEYEKEAEKEPEKEPEKEVEKEVEKEAEKEYEKEAEKEYEKEVEKEVEVTEKDPTEDINVNPELPEQLVVTEPVESGPVTPEPAPAPVEYVPPAPPVVETAPEAEPAPAVPVAPPPVQEGTNTVVTPEQAPNVGGQPEGGVGNTQEVGE